MIRGWPYSVVAALESGRASWTAVLDAVGLGPDDDETAITAAQGRVVVTRLITAGRWRQGDPAIRSSSTLGMTCPAGLAGQRPACGAARPPVIG
jgi:hypothetical protein